MDAIKLHDRALEATTAIVANVKANQFDRSTPCSEFDVETLLNHMIAGNFMFVDVAQGKQVSRGGAPPGLVGADHVASYRGSADAVSQAWSDPAVLGETVHLPFGDFPGDFALGIHFVETLVHGWDLAKATGQPTTLDPELTAFAWENVKDLSESFRGPGAPFGLAIDVPAGTPATDRLVAWLGRTP